MRRAKQYVYVSFPRFLLAHMTFLLNFELYTLIELIFVRSCKLSRMSDPQHKDGEPYLHLRESTMYYHS